MYGERYPVIPLPSVCGDEETGGNCDWVAGRHSDDGDTHPTSALMNVKQIGNDNFYKALSGSSEHGAHNTSSDHTC